jgi:hypothetical protein
MKAAEKVKVAEDFVHNQRNKCGHYNHLLTQCEHYLTQGQRCPDCPAVVVKNLAKALGL